MLCCILNDLCIPLCRPEQPKMGPGQTKVRRREAWVVINGVLKVLRPFLLFLITTTFSEALQVMVTLAPLISAAEGSLTVPTILPVPTVACASSTARLASATIKGRMMRISGNCLAALTIIQVTAAGPCSGARP